MVTAIIGLAAGSLVFFLVFLPKFGVRYLFMVRGLIDVGWSVVLGPLSVTKIMGGLIPLLVLPRILASKTERISQMPLFAVSILYLITNLCGFSMIILEGNMLQGMNFLFRVMNGFLGFFMIPIFFHDRDSFRKLLIAMLIGGLFPVVMGIYSGMTGFSLEARHGFEGGFQRSPGLFHDIVILKLFAYQTIAALLLFWEYFKPRLVFTRLLLLGYGTATSIAMYYCYSKSATLMFVLWATIWIILKRKFALLLLLPVAVLAINYFTDNRVFEMVSVIFQKEVGALEGTADASRILGGRIEGWENQFQRFSDAPLINQMLGLGSMAGGAHNDYLRVLRSNGILGMVFYSIMLLYAGLKIAIRVLNRASPLNVMAMMLYLMWIVDAIGTVVGIYPETQWLVWGMIVLALRGVDGLDEKQVGTISKDKP